MHDNEAHDLETLLLLAKDGIAAIGAEFDDPEDDWAPVLFVLSDEGMAVVDVSMLMQPGMKDLAARAMQLSIEQIGGVAAAFVSSSWTSQTTTDVMNETGEYPLPSEQADRKEIVMVYGLSADGSVAEMAEILRSDVAPPVLGEWTRHETAEDGFGGRFPDAIKAGLQVVATRSDEELEF